jgi:hypothetical protein
LPLLVATEITLLWDVSTLTKLYATLVVGARAWLHSKEVVPMRGHNRIPFFKRHPLAMLLGASMFVVIVTVTSLIGPDRVLQWLVSFLIPVAVILLVVVGTVGLLAREGGKVLDSRDDPPQAHSRISPRGEGFSSLVYWLLMSLFLLASVAMVYFFWLVVRDQ